MKTTKNGFSGDHIIIVPESRLGQAQAAAAIIDYDRAGAKSFDGKELSEDGEDPATHYFTKIRTGEKVLGGHKMIQGMQKAVGQVLHDAYWWRMDLNGNLHSTSHEASQERVGEPFGLQDAFDALDLQRIINEEELEV